MATNTRKKRAATVETPEASSPETPEEAVQAEGTAPDPEEAVVELEEIPVERGDVVVFVDDHGHRHPATVSEVYRDAGQPRLNLSVPDLRTRLASGVIFDPTGGAPHSWHWPEAEMEEAEPEGEAEPT